jgi:hypothetical protein
VIASVRNATRFVMLELMKKKPLYTNRAHAVFGRATFDRA